LAHRTGLSETHISQIINGAEPITSETALKLEITLGIPATFWSNLQKNYELTIARIASDRVIASEIEEAKKFSCYSELIAQKCIERARDWKTKTENLLKFFRVNSLSYIKNTEPIAFRQTQGKFDERCLAAWLRCGEIDADEIKTENFDKKNIKNAIPEIKKLTLHPEDFGKKLQEIFASIGIALVYTPYFKKTKVNGCARWISDRPVIQLNTRGAYSDIFWFTLFHELGHILLHGIKDKFLDYQDKAKDDKENEADKFAANELIPLGDYNLFLQDKPLTKEKVESFAKSVGINSSIVFGRLAYEGKADWRKIAHLRDRLVIN
jgi:HTH-type transcriptional regulator / antitoxin HigA